VLGVGYGVYLSVDFALCTEVLPQASARGKDLGVINIALQLPQMLAPFVGSLLVAFGGGYVTLYAVAALCCLLGSVLVGRIQGVR
jgi:MFS family permease